MCSQQQSTRQVYRQLFASHNLSMHTCRHTLLRFAHLRLHSLPSMPGDCPCVVFARPNARMHPRTTDFRVTTGFCPQRTTSSALYLLCPSLSVARQPPLLSTDFGVDISVLTLSRSSFTQLSRYARFSLVCIIFWFTFERLRIQSMLLVAFCSDRRATAAPCSLSTCAHSVSRSTSVPC